MTTATSSRPTTADAGASPLPAFDAGHACAWTVAEVENETRWIFRLDAEEAGELIAAVRRAHVDGKPLLDYRQGDFALSRSLGTLSAAFAEVRDGRGMALVKSLPRDGVSPKEFELMTWAIGLYFGVARPQNRLSAYINEVKDAGGVYRSPTGRGYSSKAELDFHVDGSDVVLLSCYNQAPVGGMSMCTSSVKAYEVMREERPDLAAALHTAYPFSRNGEQQGDEPAWFSAPLVGVEAGRVSCVWNRNRLENALRMDGVPPITALQREAVEYLDALVRRPDLMYCMHLEPGDLQLLSNQTALHSRTSFEDHVEEARKRTLYRLWIATPDSRRLPAGWEHYDGTREAGTVRGGSLGHQYDAACLRFDIEQAQAMRMKRGASRI
ncbi:MAG: gamma-butyrobetaine, 2-oxoglutarate dioxygenase (Gamma-butyrobetaine hydroxylase)-like protein [Rhizobacter sp.]|nr:gamma-butyrobetaine, 2-oxoglutarate dioxygenase (Gamma-butyrobetaine hydroxylase)-like protein [Rhizobacter sp.]